MHISKLELFGFKSFAKKKQLFLIVESLESLGQTVAVKQILLMQFDGCWVSRKHQD